MSARTQAELRARVGARRDEPKILHQRVRISYNSCRNRHCPKCQAAAAKEWLADRHRIIIASSTRPDQPRWIRAGGPSQTVAVICRHTVWTRSPEPDDL